MLGKMQRLVCIHNLYMWGGFPENWGTFHFGGPHDKDYNFFGSTLGPLFWETTTSALYACMHMTACVHTNVYKCFFDVCLLCLRIIMHLWGLKGALGILYVGYWVEGHYAFSGFCNNIYIYIFIHLMLLWIQLL